MVHPKALLVPHAGYVYSGLTAAHAYRQLENENYKTAIILGPSHQVYSDSLSIPNENAYATPLGTILFDEQLKEKLIKTGNFKLDSAPHYQEHSLEVQLPFLKYMCPNIKILPLSVGNIDTKNYKACGQILAENMTPETLLIISTDLSHFHSLNIAKSLDQKTIETILNMDATALLQAYHNKTIECCGIFPIILGLTALSFFSNLKAEVLYYDTSASSSFDDERVVGYVAMGFSS